MHAGRLAALQNALDVIGAFAEMQRWLHGFLEDELAAGASRTQQAAAFSGAASPPGRRFVAEDGRRFEPLLLNDGEPRQTLAAVLMQHVATGTRRLPNRQLFKQIAAQLLEHRDVSGAVLPEAAYTETQG